MSESSNQNSEPQFTSFVPLVIALAGFIVWFVFQDYELNTERGNLNRNLQAAMPKIGEAQQVSQRYVALMKDLVKTAQTDPAAKNIVNEAINAGLIHVQSNATNAAGTPAAPPASQ